MKMKNPHTGESAPVHMIGETDDGRKIYQNVDGWILTDDEGRHVPFDYDQDGNLMEAIEE